MDAAFLIPDLLPKVPDAGGRTIGPSPRAGTAEAFRPGARWSAEPAALPGGFTDAGAAAVAALAGA
ncbi:hypothetical protein AB6813_11545 [bacterium RCC_150]